MSDYYKLPRLYVPDDLNGDVSLSEGQAHYMRHVMRKSDGDSARLFNGRDGEFLATLSLVGKRDVTMKLEKQLRPQVVRTRRLHLLFPPLKKDRMDMLIECAVQLDVTDFHPVITERTDLRDIKAERVEAQMIEASEQCERLDIPALHETRDLDRALTRLDALLFVGLERSDAKTLNAALVPMGDCAALIGPAGGWSDYERAMLDEAPNVMAVTLGTNILRSETAALVMLTRLAAL